MNESLSLSLIIIDCDLMSQVGKFPYLNHLLITLNVNEGEQFSMKCHDEVGFVQELGHE